LIWSESAIRVFSLDLDEFDSKPLLADGEIEQAARIRPTVERQRFVKRRSALRTLLATECNLDPSQISFNYGSSGKPYLACSPIRFSLSSSASSLVIAISNSYEVGVDIQVPTDSKTLFLGLDSFLTLNERVAIEFAGEGQNGLLHQIWTRKEAAAKALGTGLTEMLSNLESLDGNPVWCGKSLRLHALPSNPNWFGSFAWIDH
jgi:4'-phosphopantetheinyl transferase